MKKITYICDRCGKEYNVWQANKTELYGVAEICYDSYHATLDEKMDLCEQCYLSLEKWWKVTPLEEAAECISPYTETVTFKMGEPVKCGEPMFP